MDSHNSETLVDASPPSTAAAAADPSVALPSNPSSTTGPCPSSSDPTVETTDEIKNEEVVDKGDQKAAVPVKSPSSGSATDLEKKMRRAERFGVAVVMSEEEKRNNRAERFGTTRTASAAHTGRTGNPEEEQKRKARAERFGITTTATVDEDSKKKARLERFSQGPKVDAAEEEKKKARALRFAKDSTSPSQPSTQENSDLNKEAVSVAGTA